MDNSDSPKSIVSSGPVEPIETGQYVKWDMFVRQGVHLMSQEHQVVRAKSNVQWQVEFKPHQGVLDFNFCVQV